MPPNKPLTEYIPVFLEYCEIEKGLSTKTAENYDRFLKTFVRWLEGSKLSSLTPGGLTDKHIWDYRLFLSRFVNPTTHSPLKKTTQSHYLVALRCFLSYLNDKDIKSLPPNKIKLPKLTDKDRQIKFLSYDQVEKLLAEPNIKNLIGLRDRSILEILFSTGFRVAELVSLNIDQFNFDTIKKLNKSYELSIAGKGGKVRTVYFSQRSLYWLQKYLTSRKDKDKALFIHHRSPSTAAKDTDMRLSSRSVERSIKKYTKMAGLPVTATPHTMRHSYATDLLSQGADLRSVQELLGHKNIATTQVYTHLVNKQLKDLYDKYHSGNKIEE